MAPIDHATFFQITLRSRDDLRLIKQRAASKRANPQYRSQHRCPYRKSNPAVLVVQPAQDRATDSASGCLRGA
jgi:hypothetical protein